MFPVINSPGMSYLPYTSPNHVFKTRESPEANDPTCLQLKPNCLSDAKSKFSKCGPWTGSSITWETG